MAVERTLAMIKPDAVRRNLVGKIIAHYEAEGFEVVGLKKLRLTRDDARAFYAVHAERPFFGELVEFITSGPVVAMEWSGESAVAVSRTLMGGTNPAEAAPGTIRGDFGVVITHNLVHGSESVESAEREELLSVVSHELRTPVTVISGYSRLLLSEEVGPLNPEQRRFLGESGKSCQRLNHFIGNLLEASRHNRGEEALDLGEGSLEATITGVVRFLRPLLEEREIQVELLLDPDALWARFDAARALRRRPGHLGDDRSEYGAGSVGPPR